MTAPAALTAPKYEERPPRQPLKHFLRALWRYDWEGGDPRTERIAADGCPELVLHLLQPYEEVLPEGGARPQPPALFAGQLTRPLTLRSAWPVSMLGVRFEPDGAREFFGAPMAGSVNRRIALADIHGAAAGALAARMATCRTLDDQFEAAQDYVEGALVRAGARLDPTVRAIVEALKREQPAPPAALSERQMQRRFKDRTGVSPRQMRSIFRFRRVFDEIEHDHDAVWTASALAAGYFDLPQMARDFRRYLGCSAREWAAEKVGLAAMLAGRGAGNVQAGRRRG